MFKGFFHFQIQGNPLYLLQAETVDTVSSNVKAKRHVHNGKIGLIRLFGEFCTSGFSGYMRHAQGRCA